MSVIIHSVGIVFLNSNGEILVLKRHPDQPEGGLWGLVGGEITQDKKVFDVAKDKAKQETGLDLDTENLIFVNDYEWYRSEYNVIFDIYKYSLDSSPVIKIDPVGSTDFMWQTPLELLKRSDLVPDLYLILKDL